MKAKNTINKDAYIDEHILKNFLELISKHLSHIEGNTVYIEINELCDTLGIKLKGDWEQENWRLGHTIEKLNLIDSGVKAIEAFAYFPAPPLNEKVLNIESIKNWTPDLDGVAFEVNIEKLLENIGRGTTTKTEFKSGTLYFKNKNIDFSNKPNQKDLLETLFKNPKKKWFYDEIQEDWDEGTEISQTKYPKDYWRKFYSAGDDINTAIAKKTLIEDFIIKDATPKGQIRINPKYI